MYCSSCGAEIKSDTHFCVECGNKTEGGSSETSTSSRDGKKRKTRRFTCSEETLPSVIASLKNWLADQKFEVQQLVTEDGKTLLQLKRGGWRSVVGMSVALNVIFAQNENAMTVEIGEGRWIDKAAVGVVSFVVLWPLAITAGVGVWKQSRMPNQIFEFIGTQCR